MFQRVTVVVLDSVGVGDAPDAADYGDLGSATLQHVAEAVGGLDVPNLEALGLGRVADIAGVGVPEAPGAATGRLTETSAGKDTTTGHWELMGIVLDRPFPTYPEG
ncbi:MAG: phosphopentomutase, partial [Actinomycetota bacterium]